MAVGAGAGEPVGEVMYWILVAYPAIRFSRVPGGGMADGGHIGKSTRLFHSRNVAGRGGRGRHVRSSVNFTRCIARMAQREA